MKDCFYQYRKGLYEALSALSYGGQNLTVMEYAPEGNDTPYVQILNMSATPEGDATNFQMNVTVDIMVVTSHQGEPGEFGSKQSDDIMTIIMQRLITKGVTPGDVADNIVMTDFEDNGCYLVALNYAPEFDGAKTTIRKILTIQTMITEV